MTDDKNRPDATDVFHTMPVRLIGEREERKELAARALSYHNPFIDDVLRAILPHDLILLTAPTGLGKTDFALSVAIANALQGVRIGYFALEAEPRELERRTKYAWISNQAWERQIPRRGELNIGDWLIDRCEGIVGRLNDDADAWFAQNLSTFRTFYRGEHFGPADLRKRILEFHQHVDLLVIDHLHYIDTDDGDDENSAIGSLIKTIRHIALDIGKPVIVIAHLRKKDARMKLVMPTIEDIHGSSNISKVCTQVITIGPALGIEIDEKAWWLAPTFISVLKDRRAGAPPFVALTMFDKRNRSYGATYQLGRLVDGGTKWKEIAEGRPGWVSDKCISAVKPAPAPEQTELGIQ